MITPHLHVSTDSLHPLHDHYSVYPSQQTTQDEKKELAAMKEFQSCVKRSKMYLKGQFNSELKSLTVWVCKEKIRFTNSSNQFNWSEGNKKNLSA